jgi:hypothetical protein
MTAVLLDDVMPVPAKPALTLQPAPKRRPHPAPTRRPQPAFGAGDPLVDAAARLLSIPLRQVYAVLWRVGVIEVRV